MSYPYTQNNLLEQPHNYMYIPFKGTALLQAYLAGRMAAMRRHDNVEGSREMLDRMLSARAFTEIARLFDAQSNRGGAQFRAYVVADAAEREAEVGADALAGQVHRLGTLSVMETVQTLGLLHALNAAQLTDAGNAGIKIWLDRLVQRFEVTKKLYDAYAPGFRKGEGGNASVRLYWLFALSLSLFYARKGSLKHLSTLLKVSDLLCSLTDLELREHIPARGLVLVLTTEVAGIQLLAESKGVTFATA